MFIWVMTDEQKPQELPSLPDNYLFPAQLLDQWVSIPGTDSIQAVLTRQDMDLFLFSAQKQADAIRNLDQALVAWSNGRNADADKYLNESRRKNIEGLNQFKQFFASIMIAALKARNDAR